MKKKQAKWIRLIFLGLATAVSIFLALYFFPIGLALFVSSLIVLTSSLLTPFAHTPSLLRIIKGSLTAQKTDTKNPSSAKQSHDKAGTSPDENDDAIIEVTIPFKLSVSGSTEENKKKRETIISQCYANFNPHECTILGEGGFGKVFMLQTQETPSKISFFAVKAAQRDIFSWLLPTEEEEALKSEAEILTNLKHSNILPVYGRFTRKNYDCMVMPLMDISLSQHVKNTKKTIDNAWIALVTNCILSALAYLHEKEWVHRDIKLENILIKKSDDISKTPRICLADFGLAERKNSQTTFAGTLPWVSPELYKYFFDERKVNWKLTEADDIYAVALIIYCLFERLTQPCLNTAEWCRKQVKVNAPDNHPFQTMIFKGQQTMDKRPSAKEMKEMLAKIPTSQNQTPLSVAH